MAVRPSDLVWAQEFYAALRSSGALDVEQATATSFTRTIAMCLALTWLNPHVYLDTVVLLGTISTRFPGQQFEFAAGAVTGSFLFFHARLWSRLAATDLCPPACLAHS